MKKQKESEMDQKVVSLWQIIVKDIEVVQLLQLKDWIKELERREFVKIISCPKSYIILADQNDIEKFCDNVDWVDHLLQRTWLNSDEIDYGVEITDIHKKPPKDTECLAYMIDIDETNYCEYQTNTGKWLPSLYCDEVIDHLIDSLFEKYKDDCNKCTCKKQMRRMIQKGPPMYLYDDHALPVEDGEYITNVWFSYTNSTKSAKLKGALEGIERQTLWDHFKTIYDILDEDDKED